MMWDSLQQDYVYPDAKDRQFLHYFYKGVKKQKFSVERYNALKDELASVRCFFSYYFFYERSRISRFHFPSFSNQ